MPARPQHAPRSAEHGSQVADVDEDIGRHQQVDVGHAAQQRVDDVGALQRVVSVAGMGAVEHAGGQVHPHQALRQGPQQRRAQAGAATQVPHFGQRALCAAHTGLLQHLGDVLWRAVVQGLQVLFEVRRVGVEQAADHLGRCGRGCGRSANGGEAEVELVGIAAMRACAAVGLNGVVAAVHAHAGQQAQHVATTLPGQRPLRLQAQRQVDALQRL